MRTNAPGFEDKFIAFIDVLGFKSIIEKAEEQSLGELPEILNMLKKLGSAEDCNKFSKYGPTTCPEAKYISKDLNFRVLQVSDCAIISCEVSPAGIINLISHCWSAAIALLPMGIMCRGYITRGNVYHTANQIIGTGYNKAYEKEAKGIKAFQRDADELGTPFIEIDESLVSYIQEHGDSCVKEMFTRLTKSDGTVSAVFPFQRLSHSFAIGSDFDAEKEKKSNDVVRTWILDFKEKIMKNVDQGNEKAIKKAEHYLAALDEQLEICNKTDEAINSLSSTFPRKR